MIAGALLLVLCAASIAATVMRVMRVSSALDLDARVLAAFTRRQRDRVRLLAASIDEGAMLGPLARALAEDDPRVRTAECNAALGDLGAALAWGEAIPDAALRACAFGTLLAVAAVLIGQEDLASRLIEVLAIGGGAVVSVLDLRRLAKRQSARSRVALDAWVAASVSPDELAPEAQEARRGAARRGRASGS